MDAVVSLTLNEAGYVVELSGTAINRAVDRGVIKAQLSHRGKTRLRTVGPAELRYLAIGGAVERRLTPAGRREVYAAMRRLPADAERLELGVMSYNLTEVDRKIAARLKRLVAIKALVDESDDAGPVLRGTPFAVYDVAALIRGQSATEILEDYPGLTVAQLKAALDYAKVYPKPGRPLPARSPWRRRSGEGQPPKAPQR